MTKKYRLYAACGDFPFIQLLNSRSEQFDGFALLTKETAADILRQGRDGQGNFYSMFTWAALLYFVMGLWKETP